MSSSSSKKIGPMSQKLLAPVPVGYVKTTSVEIDFNTLKTQQAQQGTRFDVYDDVDVASSDSRCQVTFKSFVSIDTFLFVCVWGRVVSFHVKSSAFFFFF